MVNVGIEKIDFYGGACQIEVSEIFRQRGLNIDRYANLLMNKKSVGLPFEDAVTNGVNAAMGIIERLTSDEISKIKMVITASESGVDFGKSLSTFIYEFLPLETDVRLFDIKQACYGLTAAFKLAATHICCYPDEKVLIIGSDIARSSKEAGYGEPSQGCGSIAMLISSKPDIFRLDTGAYGNHSMSLYDSFRPDSQIEIGDPDLSLMAYLDCVEGSFVSYTQKVKDVDIEKTFEHFIFHVPFGGLVKGAHRRLVTLGRDMKRNEIEADFKKRVEPSLKFNSQVGNVYCSAVYLALCGLLDSVDISKEKRIGVFSYGSGSSSEFYSGVITPLSSKIVRELDIQKRLDSRHMLEFDEYEYLLKENRKTIFGAESFVNSYNKEKDYMKRVAEGRRMLCLRGIADYRREYEWI